MENNELEIFKKTVLGDENLTYIFIHPICEMFEINLQNQQRFIQNDGILASLWTKKSNNLLFGDNRQRTALTRNGFIRWIQLLNSNIIKEEFQEKLKQYQTLIFNYLNGESLVPTIKKQYEIDTRIKELNTQINKMMVEHRKLIKEKKQLTNKNYIECGLLPFPEFENDALEPFHNKTLE